MSPEKKTEKDEGLTLSSFDLPVMLKDVVAIKVGEEGGKDAPVEAFEVTLKAVVTDGTLVWLAQGLAGHHLMMTVKLQRGPEA